MNSRKGEGKTSVGGSEYSSQKGKMLDGSGPGKVDQLSHAVDGISIDASQEGEWEVKVRKSKNRGYATSSKTSVPSNAAPRAWGHPEGVSRQGWQSIGSGGRAGNNCSQGFDSRKPGGRGNPKPQPQQRSWESAYMAPPPPAPQIRPPLQNGWQWAARGGSNSHPRPGLETIPNLRPLEASPEQYDSDPEDTAHKADNGSDEDELVEDSDDDCSDGYDSDASQKSHETRKKNPWFKGFFEELDNLRAEEISEQTRQWHCPACHNGPGAIDWYKGLQPLMTHAKTKGSKRVKLHRELATLLEEELRRKGTSVIPASEAYGQWKGLRETTDHEIVWPPMVVVMNTLLEQDENNKWIGMGNQELVDYFPSYAAVRARHSYGPYGHRGMSVLIFESSAVGYMEAERLHKHFAEQGTDRDAWERRRVLFYPGGKRQLYGYLALKEDMEVFNQHCHGKTRLKYDMRSYQEVVVSQMKQMSEENQQLVYFRNKNVEHKQYSKALEELNGMLSQKLRDAMNENGIVRLRTKIQFEENKEEMDYQESFFKDQIAKIRNVIEEKEKMFEQRLQAEQAKAKQSDTDSGTNEERIHRKEEIARFINKQVRGIEEFEEEREKLIRAHKDKKVELKKKQMMQEVELEKDFDAALTKLMQKFTPIEFQVSGIS
ncbi:protein SUPPRESSOR OF GENE SILENCING 3 homolog [Dioscorea cayenensis subsp. rotundata]|uniref:Protein SUPPRESSOR OF GENE SILENCING 3 homolog n=1 Tax=Dioscorea cayennensis subsp. rotundata TaxID=55577 RepID=A0AB40BCT7_DIOCR|nr:protein SUPPRESSOR OF GENE SILENCING 3 homolog [Dioscorea cayenensis subsp. rotundata]